jgi:hypothetical protein
MSVSIRSMASDFRALYRRGVQLREAKRRLGDRLRRARVEVFDYGDGEKLVWESKSDKNVSLKALTVALGSSAMAKSVWARLPSSSSGWYTVARTRAQRALKGKRVNAGA